MTLGFWINLYTKIADVLSKEMIKLVESGWVPTCGELRRDVRRLFGGVMKNSRARAFQRNIKSWKFEK